MIALNPEDAAEAIVGAAYRMPNETVVTIDVGDWSPENVTRLFDKIISLLPSHKCRFAVCGLIHLLLRS